MQTDITVTSLNVLAFCCQVWQTIEYTVKIEKICKVNDKTDMLPDINSTLMSLSFALT